MTIEWIVGLIDRYRAYPAAAHLLRAFTHRAPHDARAPWWLAVALAAMPGAEAKAECREALAVNVKPKFAVDAMVATIGQQLRD